MHGLNLGCGTGENTLLLKTMVGSEGKMTGLDSNPVNIKIAEEKAVQNELSQIDYRHQNSSEWSEEQVFDFVYSSLLFNQSINLSNILKQVHNSLKPGGMVMVEDLDFSQFNCFPSCYAFDRFMELNSIIEKRQVTDNNIGKQLLSVFQNAGFKNIQIQQTRPCFLADKNKRIASLTLEYIAPIIIDKKLSTPAEVQALIFELKNFEEEENSMISMPGIYQVIGYKPERGGQSTS